MQATSGQGASGPRQHAGGAALRSARRWLGCVLLGLAAVAGRMALQRFVGDELLFVVAFPATIFAALLWVGWRNAPTTQRKRGVMAEAASL